MLPPETPTLLRRVVARNAQRARQVSQRLADFAETREQRHACRALEATLKSLRGRQRREFYYGPGLRSWLWIAEEGMSLARSIEDDAELFERIAEGPHLAEVIPEGRLDDEFRRRAVALGRRLVARAFRGLPPLLAFLTPSRARFGPFPLDVSPAAGEPRIEGEVHLQFPVPATLCLERGARIELLGGGLRILQRGPAAGWTPRELLPDSGIVLTRKLVHTREGWRAGAHPAGLAGRFGRALALLREAWEAAHEDVLAHTREVVPLGGAGIAPASLPLRPGTSYIHIEGRSVPELAVDLLGRTARHRLRGLEEVARLHRDRGEAMYFSPWRRTMCPLSDILYSTYSVTFRAELLSRLVATSRRLPRVRIRQELQREIEALKRSLLDLEDAEGRKVLTAEGRRLRRALARRVGRLRAR